MYVIVIYLFMEFIVLLYCATTVMNYVCILKFIISCNIYMYYTCIDLEYMYYVVL